MKSKIILWSLALVFTGCSTITRDMPFDGVGGKAFALVVADGMVVNGSESYLFVFQKIDRTTSKFVPESIRVNFGGMGTIEGDEFKKPEDLKTTFRFGGKATSAGEYMLYSRTDFASYGYSNSSNTNCFALGAAVFRLREGHINIIPVGYVNRGGKTDPALIESQAAAVMSTYPKMSAPITNAEVVGRATFETKKGALGGETCIAQETFKFAPAANVREGEKTN